MAKPKHIPHISECLPNSDKLSNKDRFVEYLKLIIPECNIIGYSALLVEFQDGTRISYMDAIHSILNWKYIAK